MWSQALLWLYWTWLRPMCKWVLRKVTGKCELLRITYSLPWGGLRTHRVEEALKHSKTPALKQLLTHDNVNIDEATDNIMKIKSVSPDSHPQFRPSLRGCLCQICGYRQLMTEVEATRRVAYSSDCVDHEAMLTQLWQRLQPDNPLRARISKQWTDIGFQGDDPMTDFRGMGILGLHNLLFFVTQYEDTARQLLSQSAHPQYGYSFAIVGINLTAMAVQLLSAGHLRSHFYGSVTGRPRLEHFHQVYCYLFMEFHKFWMNEKKSIMEFNIVKDKFQRKITNLLKKKNKTLTSNFTQPNRAPVSSVLI